MFSTPLALSLLLLDAVVQALPNSNEGRGIEERTLHNVTAQNKAGLGWNNPQNTKMDQFFRTGKVGWYYTWSSWANDQGNSLDFVPLLWGKNDIDVWTTAVSTRLKPMFQNKAITHVLGFNEPQETGQSNLTVAEALPLWMANIQPLKTQYGLRLGSPVTSSAPSGKNWTQDFLTACRGQAGCSVDFVALHYYGTNATTMIDYITDFHNTFRLPIWVTEWACQDFTPANDQCDQEHTKAYMNTTQTFMEKTDWVERYAWFGALVDNPVTATNDLLSSGGSITALGQQYIQETPEQISQAPASTASFSSTRVITRTGTTSSIFATAALNDSSGHDPTWSVGGVPARFQGGPLGLLGGRGAVWLWLALLVPSIAGLAW